MDRITCYRIKLTLQEINLCNWVFKSFCIYILWYHINFSNEKCFSKYSNILVIAERVVFYFILTVIVQSFCNNEKI